VRGKSQACCLTRPTCSVQSVIVFSEKARHPKVGEFDSSAVSGDEHITGSDVAVNCVAFLYVFHRVADLCTSGHTITQGWTCHGHGDIWPVALTETSCDRTLASRIRTRTVRVRYRKITYACTVKKCELHFVQLATRHIQLFTFVNFLFILFRVIVARLEL